MYAPAIIRKLSWKLRKRKQSLKQTCSWSPFYIFVSLVGLNNKLLFFFLNKKLAHSILILCSQVYAVQGCHSCSCPCRIYNFRVPKANWTPRTLPLTLLFFFFIQDENQPAVHVNLGKKEAACPTNNGVLFLDTVSISTNTVSLNYPKEDCLAEKCPDESPVVIWLIRLFTITREFYMDFVLLRIGASNTSQRIIWPQISSDVIFGQFVLVLVLFSLLHVKSQCLSLLVRTCQNGLLLKMKRKIRWIWCTICV